MAIVEASVDACQEDLVEEVACIVEGMCVEAVAECKAVDDDMHLICSEVVFDQSGDCPGNTPMCGWIFRVAGSGAQGCPVGIRSKVRVTTAGANRGDRPPEVVGKLGIPATDG